MSNKTFVCICTVFLLVSLLLLALTVALTVFVDAGYIVLAIGLIPNAAWWVYRTVEELDLFKPIDEVDDDEI